MPHENLKARTKEFALDVVKFVRSLPKTSAARTIGQQLLRCGTSVGANYRSACRARSPADFINRMAIVEEEADEALYWLEILVESGTVPRTCAEQLMNEANQLLSIAISSIKTARGSAR